MDTPKTFQEIATLYGHARTVAELLLRAYGQRKGVVILDEKAYDVWWGIFEDRDGNIDVDLSAMHGQPADLVVCSLHVRLGSTQDAACMPIPPALLRGLQNLLAALEQWKAGLESFPEHLPRFFS